MAVPGHPHTGLQTASWLFTGEVEHRDTAGAHALVRPGQLNLMTAGSGIAHSEYSTPATTVLHGAQLWIALPEADRFAVPGFAHYEPPVTEAGGAKVLVFLGSLFGQTSPVPAYSALVGAEVTLAAGHWHEQVVAERAAADAARRDGDLCGLGTALFSLAEACERLNRLDEAGSHYRGALEAFAAAGDLSGEADTCIGMAELAAQQHRLADALGYARRALGTFRRAGDATGQALALSGVGWSHALLGEYHQALACCQDALVLMVDLGLREGEASTWNSLGYAHHGLAGYQQAAICYQRAAGLYRGLGDRYYEAGALTSLGDVHLSAGDSAAARRAWARALRILQEIDHADASRVRAKLTSHLSPGQASARPIPATAGNSAAHAPGGAASPASGPSHT
jgi:tetratricopeptide (TPR) repeat protein